MGHWLQDNIVEPGKLPLLLALGAFVLTFTVTRVITRMIRAGKGPFRDIRPGGVHVHHVVPGVVLTVVGGFGAVAGGRHGVAAGILAVVFGIGAGLVLDEFALILHLDDVYWSEEGRQSVEVVVLTASLVLLVLAGFSPLGVDELSGEQQQNRLGAVLTYVVNFGFVLTALFKGKARMAVIGTLVPFIAVIGALRLARPASLWAKRFYRRRHRARAKAVLRAYHHDVRWAGPRRRFQDLIGGAPDRAPLPGSRPGGGT
ncbi:hypothetical protein ACFYSH_21635 [Streptomyces sp. NPDC005791]|uniref:hypothetical protein n=1 Tax=unclassified Streptomyces TaxID=2593676 RepID=UPI0033F98A6E